MRVGTGCAVAGRVHGSHRFASRWIVAVGFAMVGWLALAGGVAYAAPSLATDRALVNKYSAREGSLLGVTPVPIDVGEASVKGEGADTLGYDASGGVSGPEVRCVITFSTSYNPNYHEAEETAAHEVFHCLSAELAPSLAVFNRPGDDWLVEGGAAWAESDLVANDDGTIEAWVQYLAHPELPLWSVAPPSRSSEKLNSSDLGAGYDAIGFFGHLASCGIDVWQAFRQMYAASSDAAAYAASGAAGCLDSEASEFFNNNSLGKAWYAGHQRNSIADGNVPRSGYIFNGRTFEQRAAKAVVGKKLVVRAFADGVWRLQPTARFTRLLVYSGTARLHSTTGPLVDENNIGTLTFCSPDAPDACHCPSGEAPPDAHKFKAGDLAITGGPTGAQAELMRVGCSKRLFPRQDCTSLSFGGYSGQLEVAPTSMLGVYSSGCEFDSDAGACPTYSCFVLALGVYSSAKDAHQAYQSTNGNQYGAGGPSYHVVGVGDEAKYWSGSTCCDNTGAAFPSVAGIARIDNDTVEITQDGFPAIDIGHLLAEAVAQLG